MVIVVCVLVVVGWIVGFCCLGLLMIGGGIFVFCFLGCKVYILVVVGLVEILCSWCLVGVVGRSVCVLCVIVFRSFGSFSWFRGWLLLGWFGVGCLLDVVSCFLFSVVWFLVDCWYFRLGFCFVCWGNGFFGCLSIGFRWLFGWCCVLGCGCCVSWCLGWCWVGLICCVWIVGWVSVVFVLGGGWSFWWLVGLVSEFGLVFCVFVVSVFLLVVVGVVFVLVWYWLFLGCRWMGSVWWGIGWSSWWGFFRFVLFVVVVMIGSVWVCFGVGLLGVLLGCCGWMVGVCCWECWCNCWCLFGWNCYLLVLLIVLWCLLGCWFWIFVVWCWVCWSVWMCCSWWWLGWIVVFVIILVLGCGVWWWLLWYWIGCLGFVLVWYCFGCGIFVGWNLVCLISGWNWLVCVVLFVCWCCVGFGWYWLWLVCWGWVVGVCWFVGFVILVVLFVIFGFVWFVCWNVRYCDWLGYDCVVWGFVIWFWLLCWWWCVGLNSDSVGWVMVGCFCSSWWSCWRSLMFELCWYCWCLVRSGLLVFCLLGLWRWSFWFLGYRWCVLDWVGYWLVWVLFFVLLVGCCW